MKALALAAISGVIFGFGLALSVNARHYDDQNAGFVVDGNGHCAGFEYKGVVGFFVDVDC